MGFVVSKLITKPIRRFNVANRAAAVISKEKPEPAPDYSSTKKQRELAKSINPNFLEEHYKKDLALDERLKRVYVESYDKTPIVASTTESKKLQPQLRGPAPDYEFGFHEPTTVPKGKCTLKQAIDFISDYHRDPATHTVEATAAKYNLDEKVVGNILEHFSLLQVYKPVKRDEEGMSVGSSEDSTNDPQK